MPGGSLCLIPGARARIVLPSGREKYVKASGQVLSEDGKPASLLVAVQDITGQKQKEAEIRRRGMQQSTLAQIGQVALSNASLGFLFSEAANAVRDMLDTDLCGIIKSEKKPLWKKLLRVA